MSDERPAVAGGTPVRTEPLPFARAELGPEEEAAVVAVLRSGWLTTGPKAAEFERGFAELVGTRFALATNSWTAGMHLLLRAMGVGPGDEVVVPAITFPPTLNAVLHAGAQPVVADVLPDLLTLDARAAEAACTHRTRALLPVHLYGWPSDMDPLLALARRRGLLVLEDAAQGVGARHRGRSVGALADGGVFSLYVTKNVTAIEGGMITTDREEIVERIRVERLHGIDLDASRRAGGDFAHWEAVAPGWKYNLNDVSAAIGVAQLAKLPRFLAKRRALDARYRAGLAALPAFVPVQGPAGAENGAQLFPVLLRPGALRIGRDEVLRALLAEGIGIGVHFRALPCHRHVRAVTGVAPEDVPIATDASERLLSLPLHTRMDERDVDDVLVALARIARFFAA
jgi:dTDP-4-amino-4,6-dideoxygalactose transaminase